MKLTFEVENSGKTIRYRKGNKRWGEHVGRQVLGGLLDIRGAAFAGCMKVARRIMDISLTEVPIDTGALISTANIEVENGGIWFGYGRPTMETISIVDRETGEITETKQRKDVRNRYSQKMPEQYMVEVHEDLSVKHKHGKAKFLEDPINQVRGEAESIIKMHVKRKVESLHKKNYERLAHREMFGSDEDVARMVQDDYYEAQNMYASGKHYARSVFARREKDFNAAWMSHSKQHKLRKDQADYEDLKDAFYKDYFEGHSERLRSYHVAKFRGKKGVVEPSRYTVKPQTKRRKPKAVYQDIKWEEDIGLRTMQEQYEKTFGPKQKLLTPKEIKERGLQYGHQDSDPWTQEELEHWNKWKIPKGRKD